MKTKGRFEGLIVILGLAAITFAIAGILKLVF